MHTLNSIITSIFSPVMFVCAATFLFGLIIFVMALKTEDETERNKMLKQAKIMTLVSGLVFCVGFGWCVDQLTSSWH